MNDERRNKRPPRSLAKEDTEESIADIPNLLTAAQWIARIDADQKKKDEAWEANKKKRDAK